MACDPWSPAVPRVQVISEEETSFGRTLLKGIERFKKVAAALQAKGETTVSGLLTRSLLRCKD
jgi:alanyl-tRNA synthetase